MFRYLHNIDLKKEVGDIKIDKLSEKKIRLVYIANIICQEIVIDTIKLKVKYSFDKEEDIYRMISPKYYFLIKLSNKLRVKINKIHYGAVNYGFNYKKIELEGIKIDNFIISIHITDENWFKTWERDKKLNILLK